MSRLTLLLICIAIAMGSYLRLVHVGAAFVLGDELHTLHQVAKSYGELLTRYSQTGAGLVLPVWQRLGADLFGLNHWTLRAPAIAGGLALLVSIYPMGRRIAGDGAALVATLLVAASSPLIYYSHFGRSYSLMIWLSLALLYQLCCIVDSEGGAKRRDLILCGLYVALLPCVHLTSLALIGAVCLATVLALVIETRQREALAVAGATIAGLLIALLCHLPAWESLMKFISAKSNSGEFGDAGVFDVAGLLLGSRLGGYLAAAVLCVGLVRLALRLGSRSLPILAACIAPSLALIVVEPFGDVYAWSRYSLASLPVLALVAGWLVADLMGSESGALRPRGNSLIAAAGVAMALALHLCGPYGLRHVDDGPHVNTYLSLFRLPDFDVPWDQTPAFYRQLAKAGDDVRIIESPALYNRYRQLYRNYYLQHGAETWLGVWPEEFRLIPDGPYVSLEDPDWRNRAQADFFILHLDVRKEALDYWGFVYDRSVADTSGAGVATYMESLKQSRRIRPDREQAALQESTLIEELGPPVYRDERIAVWDCR